MFYLDESGNTIWWNGMYIIKVMGLRGPLDVPQEKQGFFKRLAKKAQKEVEANKKKK